MLHAPCLSHRTSQVVGFGDVDPRSLEVMDELGSGSFGTVCKARWRSTYVAVKKLHRALRNKDLAEDDARVKELRDEIQIMREMRHPNVILIMAFCEDPPLIVMEYMPLGSLFEYFHQESGSKLPWALGLRMIMDITRGLAFLHAHNPPVVHRDMKSPNCLITSDWRCKVADFGISKLIEPTKKPKASAGINVFSSYVPPGSSVFDAAFKFYLFVESSFECVLHHYPHYRCKHADLSIHLTHHMKY